jgi:hypothetical protein
MNLALTDMADAPSRIMKLALAVGRQSLADAAPHDGGKGFPPYDGMPEKVSR